MRSRRRGKIINICSLASEIGRPNIVPYAVSKGGVQMLTRALAVELAPHNVQVNGIAPGFFNTDMNAALFDSANGYRGCIPGILEVLRRGGLVPSINCLNPHEVLSPGQAEELTRVAKFYPELTDDAFVASNRDKWLA